MLTLFDVTPALPEGFTYTPEFLKIDEEARLIALVRQFELKNMVFHQYEAKRRVISFGNGWSFTEQQLKPGAVIPAEFSFLLEKISHALSLPVDKISQFLITEYPPGSVINWHRDAPPFETIVGISLQSDCVFRLRPQDKQRQTRSTTINLSVQRRSMYVMTGPAKQEWQHATAPLATVRYSLTFRTLR